MAELAPHLLKYDFVEPSLMGSIALTDVQGDNQMNLSPLNDAIDVRDFFNF